jgi:hypothetical protein
VAGLVVHRFRDNGAVLSDPFMSTEPPAATAPTPVCFFICPIGQPGSGTRERAELVEKHLVKPAAEQLGYYVVRADKIDQPGIITTQVVEYIDISEMMIANLSEANPNVFYELALRHALRKPVVLLVGRAYVPSIPFDVNAGRVIIYDLNDWTSPERCVQELVGHMNAPVGPNPISTALDHLVIPKGVDTSVIDVLKSLQEQMQTLSMRVGRLQRSISGTISVGDLMSDIGTGKNTLRDAVLGGFAEQLMTAFARNPYRGPTGPTGPNDPTGPTGPNDPTGLGS